MLLIVTVKHIWALRLAHKARAHVTGRLLGPT